MFEACNKQNVLRIHKSLEWAAAVQVAQREIYCHRMENPCSRENAMNINISSISNLLTCLQNISHIPAITDKTRFQLREVFKKSKWKFKMAFAIRRPPPLMAKFPDIFSPHFFSFATESYIYETDFTLQKYHF